MVQEAPPERLPPGYTELIANIGIITKNKDGEWWRIARYESKSAGHNRATTLRKRKDMANVEFRGMTLDDDPDGYTSGLWCRYIGDEADGDEPLAYRPPNLTSVPPRRGPGRPPKRQVDTAAT